MITRLDHIALAVRDLDAAAASYQRLLGCAPNWRGADGGAEHVWFQLSNMALDIITPIGAGYTDDRVQAHLDAHGEGIWAAAFATPDIQKAIRRLKRCGVEASDARAIRSTHVDSGAKRYWTTSVLSPKATHGPLLFLVEQAAQAWPLSSATVIDGAAVSGLDHLVVTTSHPERAAALYGARLDLQMALDRTNLEWQSQLLFFRCGDLILEVAHDLKESQPEAPDRVWGLSWRAPDIDRLHARLTACGLGVSEIRAGRKAGTRVFTVREHACNTPTIVIGRDGG
jgi:catechol 2,3-dioxygenase-like lactoylglutathione lyase family enzyme